MATITVDALDAVELAEILEFLLGSLDTLVAPATIVPSADGYAHDLSDLRPDVALLVGRLLTSPLTPATTPRSGSDNPELVTLTRGEIEDIAHILGQLEDFLLHGDDDATLHLTKFLAGDTADETLVHWIGELGGHLRRRLLARNP